MRLSSIAILGGVFAAAAGLSLFAASYAVTAVEENTEIAVRHALDARGHNWAEVQADGLRVVLTGTATDEATRLSAMSAAGSEVDAARIIDGMEVAPSAALAPPRFLAEILRNDSGISIIGLIPGETDREALVDRLNDLDGAPKVADLLETAAYPVPAGWDDAIAYAVTALDRLPRSKVSVSAGQVSITAIADSEEEKQELEDRLTRSAPPGLKIALNISAPRPVITPFTLRFLIDENGARFDACSAESGSSQRRILAAARAAGISGPAGCVIGMGVPSPNWAKAAELSIASVAELGGGSVTMANADITLVAAMGTNPALFDRVVGELDTALPDVFALHPVLPEPEEKADGGPPEFLATLSPEGLVQLRGRLSDENLRMMADSYAQARFGSDSVYTATRIVDGLPSDWPVRVLAALEALSLLNNGAVTVTPDNVSLRGISERETASADIARLFSAKLGGSESYELDITYRAPPEPEDKRPDPKQCEADLADAQSVKKITFEPGSATIAAGSLDTMNRIAEILTACGPIRLEIQGHTDSQGREEMNQQLSQARAQSVLNELRARRVLTSSYAAVGYGESRPIADNGTEEGREDNRRIEFWLIRPDTAEDQDATTLESVEQDMSEAAETEDTGDNTTEAETQATSGEGETQNEQN